MTEGGRKVQEKFRVFQLAEDLAGVAHHVPFGMRHAFAGRRQSRAADARQQADERQAVRGHRFGFQGGEQTLDGRVARPAQQRGGDANPAGVFFFPQKDFSDAVHHRRGEQLRQGDRATFVVRRIARDAALKSGADLVDQFEILVASGGPAESAEAVHHLEVDDLIQLR